MWALNAPPSELPHPATRLPLGDSPGGRCLLTSTSSGTVPTSNCRIQLPSVGRHVAAACMLDEAGAPILCSAIVLGRSSAEWERDPLTRYLPVAATVTTEKPTYQLGEAPKLRVSNPLDSPLRALIVWGNRLAQRVHVTIGWTRPLST